MLLRQIQHLILIAENNFSSIWGADTDDRNDNGKSTGEEVVIWQEKLGRWFISYISSFEFTVTALSLL